MKVVRSLAANIGISMRSNAKLDFCVMLLLKVS